MKIFLTIVTIIYSIHALACSEAGPHEFDMQTSTQKTCGKMAVRYAEDLARTMVDLEKKAVGYSGPMGGFTVEKESPVLYTTQKRSEKSKLVGFNVGLNSKNKWECNFCVDMTLDDQGNCKLEKITKQMCAR